jgi:hypothetical protein
MEQIPNCSIKNKEIIMEFFVLFTFIGAILGASLVLAFQSIKMRNIRVTWYEVLLGIFGTVLLLLSIQHFFGARAELFSYAAWMGSLIFGIPALVLLAFTWQLVLRRMKRT